MASLKAGILSLNQDRKFRGENPLLKPWDSSGGDISYAVLMEASA